MSLGPTPRPDSLPQGCGCVTQSYVEKNFFQYFYLTHYMSEPKIFSILPPRDENVHHFFQQQNLSPKFNSYFRSIYFKSRNQGSALAIEFYFQTLDI